MHELSIAKGIIEIVERTAAAKHDRRGNKLPVANRQHAWGSVRKGGPAAEATLEIERPKGEAWCLDCAKTVPLARYGDPCPFCGGYRLAATGGTEMRVLELIEYVPPEESGNPSESSASQ